MNTAVYSTKQLNRHNGSNIIVRYIPKLTLLVVIMVVAILWVYLSIDSSRYGNAPKTTNNYMSSFKKDTNKEIEQVPNQTIQSKEQSVSEVVQLKEPLNVTSTVAEVVQVKEIPNIATDQTVAEVVQVKKTPSTATDQTIAVVQVKETPSTAIDQVVAEAIKVKEPPSIAIDKTLPEAGEVKDHPNIAIDQTVAKAVQVKQPLNVATDQTVTKVVQVKKPPNVATTVAETIQVKEPLNVARVIPKAVQVKEPLNVETAIQNAVQVKEPIKVATEANNPTLANPQLDLILKKAAIRGKTVLVTALNEAWAEPGSVFDLFLESFHVGMQTRKLLKHLVVITFNRKAHEHCLTLRLHCYQLDNGGNDFSGDVVFMTSDYLRLVWKKIEVLSNILRIGYNFLFTDADILWFRNPMKHLRQDADIQMSCDFFNGNASDLMMNFPNSGFQFVRSNFRTIQFYKFWHLSRRSYPGFKSQDVLNEIKSHPLFYKRRLKFRFLDTALFDGFCSAKLAFDRICTMHANCCIGLENKVHDLKVILDDWKKYTSLKNLPEKPSVQYAWTSEQRCKKSPEIEEAERLLKESQAIVA